MFSLNQLPKINYLKGKNIHLPALQNQNDTCFRTEEEKQNCFLFYLFLIYALPFKMTFLGVSQDGV